MSLPNLLNGPSRILRVLPPVLPHPLKHVEAQRAFDDDRGPQPVLVPAPGCRRAVRPVRVGGDDGRQLVVFQDGLEHVEPRGVLGVVGNVKECGDRGEDGGVEDARAVGGGTVSVVVVRVDSGNWLAVGNTGVAALGGGIIDAGVDPQGVYGGGILVYRQNRDHGLGVLYSGSPGIYEMLPIAFVILVEDRMRPRNHRSIPVSTACARPLAPRILLGTRVGLAVVGRSTPGVTLGNCLLPRQATLIPSIGPVATVVGPVFSKSSILPLQRALVRRSAPGGIVPA